MVRCPKWLTFAQKKCHHENLEDLLRDTGEDVVYHARDDANLQQVDPNTGEMRSPFADPVTIRAVVGNYTVKELDESTGLIQAGDKKMLFDPVCLTAEMTTKDIVERAGSNHVVVDIQDSQTPFRAAVAQLRRVGGRGG